MPKTSAQFPTQWNDLTRLNDDKCSQTLAEYQSQQPGAYFLNTPGYRPCESSKQYAGMMTEPAHYYKQYRSACRVDSETDITRSPLSNPRTINQLYKRPYLGSYMGAGAPSIGLKDTESKLRYGEYLPCFKSCEPTSGSTVNRMFHLPEWGNPQRVQHVVEPWTRGGEPTRDYVRRVNYEMQCNNARNNREINRMTSKQSTSSIKSIRKHKKSKQRNSRH